MLGISPNIFCAKRHWIFLVRFPLILVNNGGQRWVFRGLPKSSYPVVFTGLDDRSCVRIESADRKCVDSRALNSFRHWLEIAAHHEKALGERENFVSAKSHRIKISNYCWWIGLYPLKLPVKLNARTLEFPSALQSPAKSGKVLTPTFITWKYLQTLFWYQNNRFYFYFWDFNFGDFEKCLNSLLFAWLLFRIWQISLSRHFSAAAPLRKTKS